MKRILFLGSLPPPYGGIASHLSDMKKLIFPFYNVDLRGYSRIKFPLYLWKVVSYILRNRIDLISAYHAYPEGFLALCASRLTGVPYALTIFGELHVEKKRIYKPVLDGAKIIMASSNYCASGVKNFSDRKVTVTPYGIDLDHFKRTTKYDINYPLLFVGNVHSRFGLKVLLDALSILKRRKVNTSLLIVGDGEQVNELQDFIDEHDLPATIQRGVNYDDVAWFYNHSSILINPANTKLPCMGLSMKEAMACELPVIASDAGGIGEALVDCETGFLFPPNNPEALATAINTLLVNPKIAERYGKRGRKRAEKLFDKTKTCGNILEILNEL